MQKYSRTDIELNFWNLNVFALNFFSEVIKYMKKNNIYSDDGHNVPAIPPWISTKEKSTLHIFLL